MKKVIFILSLFIITISCKEDKSKKVQTHHAKPVENIKADGNYSVSESQVLWKGYKPTEVHKGGIAIKEGNLLVKDNQLVGGKFVIDMNSITNSDFPKDNAYNKKIVSHLKSADFFDVEKYPTAIFEITKVTPKDETSIIEGNLTIKGITKNISFPAMVIFKGNQVDFYSDAIKIDRTDFGIKYKSKKFFSNLKDKIIKDLFDISFKIQAKKE